MVRIPEGVVILCSNHTLWDMGLSDGQYYERAAYTF
jgi:hypothetical protein